MVKTLLDAVTAAGSGAKFNGNRAATTFHCVGDADASQAFSATVYVDVSNDGENWNEAAITLTVSGVGGTPDSDGDHILVPWAWYRGRIASGGISGTGANVTLLMGA